MAIKQISVTQLKYACLDPEWRKRWIRGENPPTFYSAPQETAPVYGTFFHKIAENYVGWLTSSPKAEKLTAPDILWHEMYERFAEERLTGLMESGKIDPAYHLGEALKAFCGRVSELRHRTPGFQSWQDIFLTKEFSVRSVRFDLGDDHIFISGQIDAVRTHPDHGLEVVDYKLSHGSNMKHDLLQVSIYARLLSMTKPGLRFHGVLEYYEPELHEVTVTEEEIEAVFEIVHPILYELVGKEKRTSAQEKTSQHPESENFYERIVREKRASAQEKSSRQSESEKLCERAGKEKRTSAQEKSSQQSESNIGPAYDGLSHKIQKCYADFKLKVEIIDQHEAPQLIRYKAKPAPGVKVVSLANRAEDLQVSLSLTQPPLIAPAQGCVTIDIPKEKPDMVFWRDIVKNPAYLRDKSPVSFPVGIGVDNQVIAADFADPNMCHALVAGASGSGKSEFLKCLVASLITKNRRSTLKLSIIDPKILTFGSFSGCIYLTDPIITDISSAIPCLHSVAEEMDARYRQLGDEGFEDLSQRFQQGKEDIPFHIIVFDEFADLILAGKQEKKGFETLVSRLAAKGRAAGIHLVLTTQRPDSKIVTGTIKANLPLKICLRVTTSRNSHIILDETGGESLLGRGDLLCDLGRGVERAQSPYISQNELLELTK